jgi:hypothetical protein
MAAANFHKVFMNGSRNGIWNGQVTQGHPDSGTTSNRLAISSTYREIPLNAKLTHSSSSFVAW